MRLRPDSWELIVDSDDEEAASSITMILALHEINMGTTELTEEAIDRLDEVAPDMIPQIVATLNAWTRTRTAAAQSGLPESARDSAPVRRPTAKVGRNDPCPCGSGTKFKRCCGAVTWH